MNDPTDTTTHAKKKRAWFWPVFAVGLFLANVGVILLIVFIAVNDADPLEGPPQQTDTQTQTGTGTEGDDG